MNINNDIPSLYTHGKNNGAISISCENHTPKKVWIKFSMKLSLVVKEGKGIALYWKSLRDTTAQFMEILLDANTEETIFPQAPNIPKEKKLL